MPFLAPLITAVSTWWAGTAVGSFLATIGITGSMILTAGLNVAAGLIEKAAAKKNAPPGGVQFEKQYGEEVPRQVAIGLIGMAGHDCYVNTYDSGNSRIQQVYALSDYYCDGLSRVAINGTWATLGSIPDPERGLPVVSGDFAGLVWIKFVDGTQTVADPNLVEEANPSDRWSEAHVGIGICHVIVSMIFDTEKNNSPPDFFFEFRGARLYDWRKDSTKGGSGAHRWGDYATYEYSACPIVAEFNYRRGFSINGDLFCGMEMPASDLPIDKFTAAANICDEQVEKQDGSFEPRYQLSLLIDCTRTHGENIDSMMLSCGGITIDAVDGAWPLVGSDQPVVATITDDDFVTGAPFQYQAKRSMSDLVNSVSGNAPDPDQLWSMVGYEPQISDTGLVVDRRTRDVNIDFPMVPSARQAGQLAGIYLEENRWEATISGMLRPRWQVLEAGDWVRYDSEKYGDFTFMMTESSLASLDADGPRNAQVSMQQRDGSIYDTILNPPVIVPVPPGAPAYAVSATNFVAVGIQIKVEGSTDRKTGIRFQWDAFDDVTVSAVDVEYRPEAVGVGVSIADPAVITWPSHSLSANDLFYLATTGALPTGLTPDSPLYVKTVLTSGTFTASLTPGGAEIVTTGSQSGIHSGYVDSIVKRAEVPVQVLTVSEGVLPKKTFEYRHRIITNPPRATFFTAWSQVSTPAEVIDVSVGLAQLQADTIAFLTSMSASLQADRDKLAQLAAATLEAAGRAVHDNAVARRFRDASAAAFLELDASVDEINGELLAQATAILGVQASVADVSAGGLFQIRAEAGSGDVVSRMIFEVRASVGAVWISSGIYIEAGFTGGNPALPFSRIVLNTNEFVVTDGTATGTPLTFQGGVLKSLIANLGTVTAGLLQSPDGSVKLDLNNKFFQIAVP
ncbi:phage tail protein [Mesorhizobium sp. B1-1-2]|uniref:phage tail protein n=1 Tax=Mesorhizobium sp. B1-1-2 TaxID=2589982 RepID=UPI00112CFF61|nr:phage tail protein [Mesorhizobium sp. B1-1-2]TPN79958.1 hypothetical protein FJ985_01625 [Mesorhizobium sp. B1-1-2]